MQYNKTNWIEKETIITSDAMNNIENGIEQVFEKLNKDNVAITALEEKVNIDNSVSEAIQEAIKENNIDLTESKIADDIYFASFEPTVFTFDNYLDVSCELLIKSNISAYENVIQFIEGQFIRILDSVILYYGFGSFEVFNYNISQYKGKRIKFRATLGPDKVKRIYINNTLIAERYNENNKLGVTTNNMTLINNDLLETSNLFFANREISQIENNHIFSWLNATPSINKINDYVMSTNTTHVQDRAGRTQDNINHMFYKSTCKEFTSAGEDIVVNNGLDGYLFGAKLEGQTVKNEIKTPLFNSSELIKNYYLTPNISNGVVTVDCDGSNKNMFFVGCYTSVENTSDKYYISMDIMVNSYVSGNPTLAVCLFSGGYSLLISELKNRTVGKYERYSQVMTSYSQWVGNQIAIQIGSLDNFECSYSFKDPIIINLTKMFGSGKEPTKEQCDILFNGFLPFGLSSAKATISNNGDKYSFYTSEEGEVIELKGLVGATDTLEILDDGSGIYTKRVGRKILTNLDTFTKSNMSSTETLSTFCFPFSVFDGIDKNIYPTITPISNRLTYKSKATTEGCFYISSYSDIRITVDGNLSINQFKEVLSNDPIEIVYLLGTPVTTHIPKELMPQIIPTYETNNFTFGDEVKPSKASVTIPVNVDNILAECFEREIAKLEYKQIVNEV